MFEECAVTTTWVLVADGAKARLFEMAARDGQWVEIDCLVNPEGRTRGRDLTTERRPMVDESRTPLRHALEPHTPPREKSAERFVRALREVLEQGRAHGRYERLVLVAPSHFLGLLRSGLGDPLCEYVTAEIRRDLTALPAVEVRARLPGRLFREPHAGHEIQ